MGNLKIPTISMFISSLESPSHCNGNDYDHLAMLLSVREANTWRHMSSTTLIFSKEGTNFHLTSHVYHGDTVIQFAATFHQPEIPRCGGCNFKTTQWTNQYTSVTYLKKKVLRGKNDKKSSSLDSLSTFAIDFKQTRIITLWQYLGKPLKDHILTIQQEG